MNTLNEHNGGIGSAVARRRRYRLSFLVSLGGALLGGFMLKSGTVQHNDSLLITALFVLAGAGLWGVYLYHRSIDEHEKEALFWANSIGLYTMIVATFASLILRTLSNPIMISIQNILLAGMVTAGVTWLWKKYR